MSLPNRAEFRVIEQRRSAEDLKVLISAYAELLPILEEWGYIYVVDEKTGEPVYQDLGEDEVLDLADVSWEPVGGALIMDPPPEDGEVVD